VYDKIRYPWPLDYLFPSHQWLFIKGLLSCKDELSPPYYIY